MIRLRTARIEECAALEALQRRASLSNPAVRAAIEAHPDAVDLPEAQIAEGHVFVAERADGAVDGFAVVLPRADGDAELDGLFVEPALHRQGIGKALVARVVETARARGAAALHVVGNPAAAAFYRACGFRETGATETAFGPALAFRFDLAPTLGAWLRAAARAIVASQSPRLDARLIARHVLGLDEAGLIMADPQRLTAGEILRLDGALARRVAGEPIAYVTGTKEFWGLTIRCRAPTLLPRPDSETLVSAVLKRRARKDAPFSIADLGTGTGCLLAALLTEYGAALGVGVDVSDAAVRLAKENFGALGLAGRASARLGDWTRGLDGPFDIVVANPPYVPETERATLAVDIVDYEDPGALFGGVDGLSAYRAILEDLPRLVATGGLVVFELGAGLAASVDALARRAFPGARLAVDDDLAGRARAFVIDCA